MYSTYYDYFLVTVGGSRILKKQMALPQSRRISQGCTSLLAQVASFSSISCCTNFTSYLIKAGD